MSIEIEMKAHISQEDKCRIINILNSNKDFVSLGEVTKQDTYWSLPDNDSTFFRTRIETQNGISRIYFTSKPNKERKGCLELNEENEFSFICDSFEEVNSFCNSLNLKIIRRKYKTGCHYNCLIDSCLIHCEIFDVKYLGLFVEAEIVQSKDDCNPHDAELAILKFFNLLGISEQQYEPRGYNKLLKECGHTLG